MDSKLIAEVFVETTDGDYEVATGFHIARNRILTVAHVFRNCKRKGEVLIRLYVKGERVRKARVIWPRAMDGGRRPGRNSVDACVLEITEDAGLCEPTVFLRHTPITTTLSVEGRGFPAIARCHLANGENEIAPQAESIIGFCSHFDSNTPDRSIHLTCTNGFARRSDWTGASGFPLFAWNELIAIGCSYMAERASDTIECVPIPLLLKEDGFKQAIAFDEIQGRASRRESIRESLSNLLKGKTAVAERIYEDNREKVIELGISGGRFLDNKPAAVAEFLLSQQVIPLLRITDLAHRRFVADRECDEGSLDCLEQIQDMFVPIAIWSFLDPEIETRLHTDIVEAPFTLPITAEALMAAVEGRELSLVTSSPGTSSDNGKESLVGSAMLNDPPDRGLDGDGAAWVGDVMIDIARRKSPLQLTKQTLARILHGGLSQEEKNRKLASLLTIKLEDHSAASVDGPKHFYFAISPALSAVRDEKDSVHPDSESKTRADGTVRYSREQLIESLRKLKEVLPKVVVITLGKRELKIDGGSELEVEEFINGRQRRK